jgi:hypothetical protein
MFKKVKSMAYDDWSNLLQIATVVFAALLIWVQIMSGKDKDAKAKAQEQTISEINLKVEQESLKRIEAETRLLELQKRISWRYFDHDKFVNILKLKDKGKAEIVYFKDDNESYMLAQAIWMALEACEWNAESPVTGKNNDPNGHLIPFDLREGGMIMSDEARIIVTVHDATEAKPYNKNTPLSALLLAFETCNIKFIQTTPHERIRPPIGTIRIVVGSRF